MSRNISLHKTSLCGKRPTNEDVEKYNMNMSIDGTAINPNYAPIDFFVVLDGHGGSQVAEYVAPKLEKYLTKKKLKYPLSHSYICKIYNHIQKSLIDHPDKIAEKCGCTALVMVRYLDNNDNRYIQIINLGDCRAILSRKGLAIPLSKDHKPYWPDEKRRIDKVNKEHNTNEQIHFDMGDWRIGDLSVSRSFGDLDNTPYVSHIPDSFCYPLSDDDEFIILGCDGVMDVLENHETINFIRDHLNNNNINLYEIENVYPSNEVAKTKNIARKLAEYAICRGSTDNISVMIIFFDRN